MLVLTACGDGTGPERVPAAIAVAKPLPPVSAAGFELADSVGIRVTDAEGRALADVPVAFEVISGSGTVSHPTRTTNALGVANVAWRLGTANGVHELRATVGSHQTTVSVSGVACTPLSLDVGQILTLADNDPRCLLLSNPSGRYLFTIVNTASSAGTTRAFRFRGATDAQVAAQPVVSAAVNTSPKLSPARALTAQTPAVRDARAAHEAIRLANERLLQQAAGRRRSSVQAYRRFSVVAADPPAVGDTLQLYIPGFSDLCSVLAARQVKARVAHAGAHGIILEDINAPLAGQIDTLYARLGDDFDNQMWQVLTENFGDPLALDAETDANERFYMLFSPVVNGYQGGNIAGFVSSGNFFPPSAPAGEFACPASNLAEIFYAIVPTRIVPDSAYASDTPGDWYRRMRTIMVHEVKHIVSFAERLSRNQVATAGFNAADRWLEESSAVLAEELWGRAVFGYQPESNLTYQQTIHCEVRLNENSFPECPQPYKPLNILDAFILLHDYLSNPEGHSPIGAANDNDFTFYGSGWSFLRWLIDHYAPSESGFLRALTQETALPGTQNIEARIAGRSFAELINEWAIALIMDDYANFTPANTRHSILSWNTRDIFAGLNRDFGSFFPRAYPLVPRAVSFGKFAVDVNSVRGGSMSVFEVSGAQSGQQLFEVSGLNGTNFSMDLRVNIIRVE